MKDFPESENMETEENRTVENPEMSHKKKKGKRIVFWSLMGVVALTLVSGNYGAYEIYKIQKQKTVLEQEIERLQQEHNELIKTKERAKSDMATIEKIAREKYSMIKEGERVYQVIPKNKKN
jgi:cell division protein FtsB